MGRHPRDFNSIEVKIALKTVKIRNAQEELIKQWPYTNQARKHSLTHMLKLLYKPMPWDSPPGVAGHKENIERKKSIERLTDLWCDELQRHRLTAYRRKLEAQQPEFLRRKADKLEEIMKTEQELGIEATVTMAVEDCRRRASEIDERLKKEETEEEEDYMIFA